MVKWFCVIDGKHVGPIEPAKLKQLADEGTLNRHHKIRREDMAQWTEASQVKGLFGNAEPQAAAAVVTANTRHEPTSTTVSDTAGHQRSSVSQPASDSGTDPELAGIAPATKITLAICGTLALPILGFFLWFVAIRDPWETNSAASVTAQLDKADHLQQSDATAAYKMYGDLLTEAKRHKLKDEQFITRLADAEKSRTAIYPVVQEKERAEEAERKRQADEQARREAAEQQRLAQEHAAEIKSRLHGRWKSLWKIDEYYLIYEFRKNGIVDILDDDEHPIAEGLAGSTLLGIEAPYHIKYELDASKKPPSVVFRVSDRESHRSGSLQASLEFVGDKRIRLKNLEETPDLPLHLIPHEGELVRWDGTEKIESISGVSWHQIDSIYNVKSGHTNLQKKSEWSGFQGKIVDWTGKVSYVSEGLAGLTLQVKMNPDTLTSDVLVTLKSHEYGNAIRLHEGDEVRFTGKLEDWGTILPITLTEGRIIQ